MGAGKGYVVCWKSNEQCFLIKLKLLKKKKHLKLLIILYSILFNN